MILNIEPLLYGHKQKRRKRRYRCDDYAPYEPEPSPIDQLMQAWTLEQLKKAIEKAEKKDEPKKDEPKKKKWFEMDAQNLAAIIFLTTFFMVPIQMWLILSVLKEIIQVSPK